MTRRPLSPCNTSASRYVALGDSITAGYMDGALYDKGQMHSYPFIIATQLAQKNGGVFKQPMMRTGSSGINLEGEPRLTLTKNPGSGQLILSRLSQPGDKASLQENTFTAAGPFNNMGVPGAKVTTMVLPGFGNPGNGAGYYNPFFTRMASQPATCSMLADALLPEPGFFSLFIGNNDVLGYALSGGTQDKISPLPAFESCFRRAVDTLTDRQVPGIVANLPSLTDIPYFTTIPHNGLLLTAAEAVELNQVHHAPGMFREGLNHFLAEDPGAGPGVYRQLKPGDKVLLDLLLDPDGLAYLNGSKPIPKKYTLFEWQVSETESAIKAYNLVISKITAEKGLALVDINALLKTAKPDRRYNTETRNLDYAKKGIFSLDGLHPNAFGQALLANEFIRVINLTFNCDIPTVRSHVFRGIEIPS